MDEFLNNLLLMKFFLSKKFFEIIFFSIKIFDKNFPQ